MLYRLHLYLIRRDSSRPAHTTTYIESRHIMSCHIMSRHVASARHRIELPFIERKKVTSTGYTTYTTYTTCTSCTHERTTRVGVFTPRCWDLIRHACGPRNLAFRFDWPAYRELVWFGRCCDCNGARRWACVSVVSCLRPRSRSMAMRRIRYVLPSLVWSISVS